MIETSNKDWLLQQSLLRESLSEMESKKIVQAYNIPTNKAFIAQTAEHAQRFAKELGFPVALKVDSHEIVHKSEAGGVALHLQNEAEVAQAFETMQHNLAQKAPGKSYAGIGVHEMKQAPYELIIGAKRDPVFGPILLVGIGGIYAELLKDVAIRLAPVSFEDAKEMIASLKMGKILFGYRGKPLADVDAAAKIIVSLSTLMLEQPTVKELDLNPVLVDVQGKGAVAVDASIIIEQSEQNVNTYYGNRSALKRLLNPTSVAIVGASNETKKVGGRLLHTLLRNGYEGEVYPISKSGDTVQNVKAYDSISKLNKKVDVVSLVIPPKAVIETVLQCIELGIENIIINSSGFSEAGEEGTKIQKQIAQLAYKHQLNIVGPNSQGIIDFNQQYFLSFSSVVNMPNVKKGM